MRNFVLNEEQWESVDKDDEEPFPALAHLGCS